MAVLIHRYRGWAVHCLPTSMSSLIHCALFYTVPGAASPRGGRHRQTPEPNCAPQGVAPRPRDPGLPLTVTSSLNDSGVRLLSVPAELGLPAPQEKLTPSLRNRTKPRLAVLWPFFWGRSLLLRPGHLSASQHSCTRPRGASSGFEGILNLTLGPQNCPVASPLQGLSHWPHTPRERGSGPGHCGQGLQPRRFQTVTACSPWGRPGNVYLGSD